MADDVPATLDSKQSSGVGLLWLIPVLVLLYVLSPGPVIKVLKNRRPSKAIEFIYAPLIFLHDEVPVVHSFYDWYFKLWGL